METAETRHKSMDLLRMEASLRTHVDFSTIEVDHDQEANKLLAPYTQGWCDALDMYAKIAHLKKIVEIAENSIKDAAVDYVANNYGKGVAKCGGLEIKYRGGVAKYNYDNTPLINELENRLKFLKDTAKALQKSGVKSVADVETGELIFAAAVSHSKDTIETKYKK